MTLTIIFCQHLHIWYTRVLYLLLLFHGNRHGDVVLEDPIPDQSTLLKLFGEMVPAQRPLRPVRTERKKVLMQDISGQDLKILLTVVRGYDVPVRTETDPMSHRGGASSSSSLSRG